MQSAQNVFTAISDQCNSQFETELFHLPDWHVFAITSTNYVLPNWTNNLWIIVL